MLMKAVSYIKKRLYEVKTMKVGSTLSEDAYKFDGKLSLKQAIPLGLQHVMAMFCR